MHFLGGSVSTTPTYMVLPQRPMGCQFMNVHSKHISSALGCNTNVQMGDICHMFYRTMYTSKSTQAEDRRGLDYVYTAIFRRIAKMETNTHDQNEEYGSIPVFTEGLSRLLPGIYSMTSHDVVSTTMAHLIMS